ncbi:hypothetical protein Acsp01_25210 [Actinoplanes sp. NBRC 101535]|nr:hypothetical protein Acsp01_25210 [Actinoplanes sp. NBRC 101535]
MTHPTGQPGGIPTGHPTRIGKREDPQVKRALELENSAAVQLAGKGHNLHQNPSTAQIAQAREATGDTGKPKSEPDYLLDGRVFDCYSPSPTKPVRGIWTEVAEKVSDGQTQRVVVNTTDWQGDMSDLQRQFSDWPIDDLKEVKVLTQNGDIMQIIPFDGPK